MAIPRVRVRFAPSPTGPLHMGGVRTALYNYLFARHHGGDFLLRIEDTDQNRFVPGAEAYILEALRWCGIEPDEGGEKGGPVGPYKQSERSEIYREAIEQLLASGQAYRAFDTPEEMEVQRQSAEARGEVWQYDAARRGGMRNDLALPQEEVQRLLAEGTPHVIRFRMPDDPEEVVVNDIIRGEVRVSSAVLDDKVMMKADGLPTYHFANIVDDHAMGITHVIRGEEWLPSAPLHTMLYRAMGWNAPAFAHLPLILKPTGNGKLSKRDGDAGGFPVFPLEWVDPETGKRSKGYREAGYLPEAFLNMLLLLGWSPGDDTEVMSMEEAVKRFDLDRVVKSGARFNPDKARWFNAQHLRMRPRNELVAALAPMLPDPAFAEQERCEQLLDMMLERVDFLHEIAQTPWLFKTPETFDRDLITKRWKPETSDMLRALEGRLSTLKRFNSNEVEAAFQALLQEKGWSMGNLMLPFRIVLTGAAGGPSMFDFAAFLGQTSTLNRLQSGLTQIESLRATL